MYFRTELLRMLANILTKTCVFFNFILDCKVESFHLIFGWIRTYVELVLLICSCTNFQITGNWRKSIKHCDITILTRSHFTNAKIAHHACYANQSANPIIIVRRNRLSMCSTHNTTIDMLLFIHRSWAEQQLHHHQCNLSHTVLTIHVLRVHRKIMGTHSLSRWPGGHWA